MEQGRIAITHAGESLAEAILEKLTESGLDHESIVLLGDESKVGVKLAFGGSYLAVEDQHEFDYSQCSLVLLTQHDDEIASKLKSESALVLSHVHGDGQALIYAASNNIELDISYTQQNIQLVSAELACLLGVLPALHAHTAISTINTTFLRSVESKGKAGVDELAGQTVELLNGRDITPAVYPLQIAFNIIPTTSIPAFNDDLARLLGDNNIECAHQIIDVPVFHGLGVAVQLSFQSNVDLKQCEKILKKLDNVVCTTTASSPITDCNQSFNCTISGLEQALNQPNKLQFWLVADPLRYGLTSNYVNVVDILLKSFL
ncbi:MAG: aspartate-semialdehyde dehydrogenase [Gammaproteobacteria bacterium]|jgi:aspartate-semialdehyde dehydrogenase